jgi:hypothetical protein
MTGLIGSYATLRFSSLVKRFDRASAAAFKDYVVILRVHKMKDCSACVS